MKKIMMSLALSCSLLLGASNEELAKELELLKQQMQKIKSDQQATNQSILDEIVSLSPIGSSEYESFSSMGGAASKVYNSQDALSIGGYGEYTAQKYFNYENFSDATLNETKNKFTTSILRFVPYIGYKFNDWIIMNTEIEFEDGGARSDGTKNYKYAIVEFSYLDFLIDESFNIRVGHILTPMGLINLNHEPVSFQTVARPTVENMIIPSTWHTNGLLVHGEIENFEYYAGVVIAPDAGEFGAEVVKDTNTNSATSAQQTKFIKNGRHGAKAYSDDVGFVARGSYDLSGGLNIGGSAFLAQSDTDEGAKVDMFLAEVHMQYKNNGWDIQALATYGKLGGDVERLRSATNDIADSVHGEYLMLSYNIMPMLSRSTHKFYVLGEIENLDMDVDGQTTYVGNNRFMEYTTGINYFPDPKVAIKANYEVKDYASDAKLKDERALTFALGFIF